MLLSDAYSFPKHTLVNSTSYFFSYSRSDSEFVKRLATDLKNNGINVWLDQLDIPPGARWDAAIEQALNSAEGILIVLSNTSVASENVMDEVAYAIDQNKKVIPLLIHNCNVPYRLARLQRIDFTGNYNTALQELLTTLAMDEKIPATPNNKSTSPVVKHNNRSKVISMVVLIVLVIAAFLWLLNKKEAAAENHQSAGAAETNKTAVAASNTLPLASATGDSTGTSSNAISTSLPALSSNENVLIASPAYHVTYKLLNQNVVFTIETSTSPGILADVNQNFAIDQRYDRRYGLLGNGSPVICARYIIASGAVTPCGSAPSAASLSVKNNVYTFSIPLSELKSNAASTFIAVQFIFTKPDGKLVFFPARKERIDFSKPKLYLIPV